MTERELIERFWTHWFEVQRIVAAQDAVRNAIESGQRQAVREACANLISLSGGLPVVFVQSILERFDVNALLGLPGFADPQTLFTYSGGFGHVEVGIGSQQQEVEADFYLIKDGKQMTRISPELVYHNRSGDIGGGSPMYPGQHPTYGAYHFVDIKTGKGIHYAPMSKHELAKYCPDEPDLRAEREAAEYQTEQKRKQELDARPEIDDPHVIKFPTSDQRPELTWWERMERLNDGVEKDTVKIDPDDRWSSLGFLWDDMPKGGKDEDE
ncbi:hypothetical protein [uncultured Roseibium sp.]|uniref:hypothetical protein n=1 Tax=uncultured Roseibium sp. TaxID=1936171 RepID=UPI00321800B0